MKTYHPTETYVDSNAQLSHPPLEIDTQNQVERFARLDAALRVVRVVSNLVGNKLDIYTTSELDDVQEPGVYWFDTPTSSGRVRGANFDFTPSNLSGAADSAHAVVPGQLQIDRVGGKSKDYSVVAKCYTTRTFEDSLERAKKEVELMRVMYESGELSINPKAIAVAPFSGGTSGEIVLITEYDPTLVTLDNLPWNKGLTEDNISNAVLSAAALGRFNVLGYRHGDAKIKNVAQNETGTVSMIDFETTESIDVSNTGQVASAVHADLESLFRSLQRKGFFGTDRNPLYALNISEAVNAMVEAYMVNWADSNEAVQDAVILSAASAVDSILPNLAETTGYYKRSKQS